MQEHRKEIKQGEGHVKLAAKSPRAQGVCPAHHILQARDPDAIACGLLRPVARGRQYCAVQPSGPSITAPVSLPAQTVLLAAPCMHRSLHHRSCGQDTCLIPFYWHAPSHCTQLSGPLGKTAGAQACKQQMTVPEPTLVTSKPEASEGRANATSI